VKFFEKLHRLLFVLLMGNVACMYIHCTQNVKKTRLIAGRLK